MHRLPAEAPDYFPLASGRYEVKPGLARFGKPFGGGEADEHVFQLDATFPFYRQGKLACRDERLNKYFQTRDLSGLVLRRVIEFMAGRLTKEHPQLFSTRAGELQCALSGDRIPVNGPVDVATLDALAAQVQEDFAVVSTENQRHWLSAVHLCFPNHWAAEDKIGKSFAIIHQPVAGMEQMNQRESGLVNMMVAATEGLVRFAWGITWDNYLNHHPVPPPGQQRATRFDPRNPQAFLRVERQTLWGFLDVNAAFFTIRTYLYDCAALRRDARRRELLVAAVESMTPAAAAYKGLDPSRDAFLQWMRAANSMPSARPY